MKNISKNFCILTLFLFFFACEATSENMIQSDKPNKIKISSQKSRIVFIRPGYWGKNAAPAIIDQNGKYIGETLHNSYFFSDLNPGNYTFTAWWEDTNSMKANLEAGKTYYVKVYATPTSFGNGRFNLLPIKKDSPEWKQRENWMQKNPFYIPDVAGGQNMLDKIGKKSIESMVEKGINSFNEYNNNEKDRRTLFHEDGE